MLLPDGQKFEDMCIRLDTIHDGQTDGQKCSIKIALSPCLRAIKYHVGNRYRASHVMPRP